MARTRAAGARRHEGEYDPGATRHNPPRASRTAQSPTLRRSKRSHSRNRSMREASSDSEDSDSPSSSDANGSEPESIDASISDGDFESRPRRRTSARQPTKAKSRRQSPRQASAPKTRARRHGPNQHKRNPLASPPKKRRTMSPPPPEPVSQGVIPDWLDPRVSYSAWTNIFRYAALDGGPDSLDVNWLVGAATTCRTLSEAALTAIYRCPPITTAGKARRLVALLDRPRSETRFNYRAKIRSIYIDISIVPQNLLCRLVHRLPCLKELVFFSPYDQPPYRQLDHTVRWHYTEDIFQAMLPSTESEGAAEEKEFHTRLSSWEWSGRLLGGQISTLPDITRIHELPSFQGLTRISFTNFQVPSLNKWLGDEETEIRLWNEDGEVIKQMAEAISALKHLEHLVFESSTVMNERLLPLLPTGLVHLSLINCWEVKSDEFGAFLRTHGRHLRTLVLSHNQSLAMGFLTSLADCCPELEEIHMNLSYYRHHDSRSLVKNDADPMYEYALVPREVPKWPSSIRVLDFEHVSHWSVEAAEVFLQSLLDSAGSLTNLRHLALKTMLNIPWKARADMRCKWRDKLDKVFLRPFEPPRYNPSLHQPPSAQVEEEPNTSPPKRRKVGEPSRRSGRIAAQASDSDSHSRNTNASRSRRPMYRELDTDEDEEESEMEEDAQERGSSRHPSEPGGESDAKEQKQAKQVVQGLCKTVSVIFDNQKPRELQYGMEDFLDDGPQSDEEWDGDEDEDDAVFIWD